MGKIWVESFELKCSHTLCLKNVTLVGIPSSELSVLWPWFNPSSEVNPISHGIVKQQQQNHTLLLGTRDCRGGRMDEENQLREFWPGKKCEVNQTIGSRGLTVASISRQDPTGVTDG